MISSDVANTPFTKSTLCYITLLQNKDKQSVKAIHMSQTQFNQFCNDQCNLVNLHVCVSMTYSQHTDNTQTFINYKIIRNFKNGKKDQIRKINVHSHFAFEQKHKSDTNHISIIKHALQHSNQITPK